MTTLRLAVRCVCGRAPPIHETEFSRELHRNAPDSRVVRNWRCRCGNDVPITVGDVKAAKPVDPLGSDRVA